MAHVFSNVIQNEEAEHFMMRKNICAIFSEQKITNIIFLFYDIQFLDPVAVKAAFTYFNTGCEFYFFSCLCAPQLFFKYDMLLTFLRLHMKYFNKSYLSYIIMFH